MGPIPGIPMNSPQNYEDAGAFVRYILLVFGFLFVLIFGKVLGFYLDSGVLSLLEKFFFWPGVSLFFAYHAYALSRIMILYAKHDLSRNKSLLDFGRHTRRDLSAVLAAHVYCIVFPCIYLLAAKPISECTNECIDYLSYIMLDISLLVALAVITVWFQKSDRRPALGQVDVVSNSGSVEGTV